MFWKILGAIGVGSIVAMAILLMVTDGRVNAKNRVPFTAVSDPVLEQERRAQQIALLQKETEITLLSMDNTAQLQMEKERILQQQRLRNEINFTNMLDFFRWAFVASVATFAFIAGGLWALRLVASIDNVIYSFIFAPTRIATIDRRARLIQRENTPLLTSSSSTSQREPVPTTGWERGTRNTEPNGNHRNRPAHMREGGRRRVSATINVPSVEVIDNEPATIEVGEFTLSRTEYLQLSNALDNGRESKSAIARRLSGRYQTNLQKLNAIIAHRNRYERNG